MAEAGWRAFAPSGTEVPTELKLAPHFVIEKWFSLLVVGLMAAMAAVQVLSVRDESQTWDEGFEIASGYSYLKTGDYRISPEHPPLARVIAALPLLWLDPAVPVNDPSWIRADDRAFGEAFVYRNRVPADRIVFWARMPMVVVTFVLGIVVALWARRTFGTGAGLGCLVLFAFDPNLIAIGRYVKNDVLVTLLGLLALVVWRAYLAKGGAPWLVGAGGAFGLALATKFSALFLGPVFVVTWFIARWQQRRALAPLRCALAIAVVCAVALPFLLALYAPAWQKLAIASRSYRATHPEAVRLADGIHVETRAATLFTSAATRVGLQNHPLLVGLAKFIDHSSGGHPAYLLGRISVNGWWYYLPFAFVVKSPVVTVAAICGAALVGLRRWRCAPHGWLRGLRPDWLFYAVPIVVYLPISIANRVNTGERHLFPIYPFVFALTAAILSRAEFRRRTLMMWVAAGLLAAESLSVYPHYLAFFNVAAGGPGAGARYLADSNLDWGQDLLHLRDYWVSRGRPPLCLDYFGTAIPEYYGIRFERVPHTSDIDRLLTRAAQPQRGEEERQKANCVAAVSVTDLLGIYTSPEQYRWLREREPVDKIGYSIYVYDLRRR